MAPSKRIGIGGLALESASFLPMRVGVSEFEGYALRGARVIDRLAGTASVGGGFIRTLEDRGAEIVPLLYVDAGAAGPAEDEAFEKYRDELCQAIGECGPFDGLLLFLHGAMTTPRRTAPELELLDAVRGVVGEETPVHVALDLHGNLDQAMLDHADALFGFHYSPHTDMAETGARAADLLLRRLEGTARPVCAIAKPPVVLPSIFTATDLAPLSAFVAESIRLADVEDRILDVSIFTGFAYADVPQLGFSVVVIADDDRRLAQRTADRLTERIWEARHRLLHRELVFGLEDGVARAVARSGGRGPVVLLEHADRMNDSTWGLRELCRQRVRNAAAPFLWDPEAARTAVAGGVGAEVTLPVGGRSSARAGGPVELAGRVLYAGHKRFVGTGPMRKGREIDLGPTALIDAAGILVSVTSRPVTAIDEDPFLQFGLQAHDFDVILLRSKTHFRAVYEKLAAEIIIIDTPDWGPADLKTLPYRHARRGVFPITVED